MDVRQCPHQDRRTVKLARCPYLGDDESECRCCSMCRDLCRYGVKPVVTVSPTRGVL